MANKRDGEDLGGQHGSEAGYLHGYTPEEQERLVSQALYLEPWIYAGIDYAGAARILEVGCGVGAQLRILQRRFPRAQLTGVDRSRAQLDTARRLLGGDGGGRVHLVEADGAALPFAAGAFDALFLCWVLEHAPDGRGLLAEAVRVLAPGATVYCTEVYNPSLYTSVACPALDAYWQRFNARQRALGGTPDIGVHLPARLAGAGLRSVSLRPVPFLMDRRTDDPAARAAFFEYWQGVLLSGEGSLRDAGLVDDALVRGVKDDFARLTKDLDAVFYVCAMQARAER